VPAGVAIWDVGQVSLVPLLLHWSNVHSPKPARPVPVGGGHCVQRKVHWVLLLPLVLAVLGYVHPVAGIFFALLLHSVHWTTGGFTRGHCPLYGGEACLRCGWLPHEEGIYHKDPDNAV